jgi:hypothetical protein
MPNLILDPILAQRAQALFPISEGNQAQTLPVNPVAGQIVPVVVLNPSTLIPYIKSGSFVGAGSTTVDTVTKGFHTIITYMTFFNPGAGNSIVSVYDGSTLVWSTVVNGGAVVVAIAPIQVEFLTNLTLNCNAAVTINYTLNGYQERISNV